MSGLLHHKAEIITLVHFVWVNEVQKVLSMLFMFMQLRTHGNTKLCPTVYAIPVFKQHSHLSTPFVSVGELISQLTTSVIMSDLEQVVMTQGSSWHLKYWACFVCMRWSWIVMFPSPWKILLQWWLFWETKRNVRSSLAYAHPPWYAHLSGWIVPTWSCWHPRSAVCGRPSVCVPFACWTPLSFSLSGALMWCETDVLWLLGDSEVF